MKSNNENQLFQQATQHTQPINGSLELLPLCNMNCDMCYVRLTREEMESKGRLRTVDEWLDVAHQMKKAGTLFLLLTGGEPLLYPGFKELYVELKKMGMILTINTNGTLMNEEWAEFFGKYKPRRINITLYGTDDRAYEELCHYPGGFQKTVDGIRRLREKGVDVKISVSLTKENQNEIEKFYEIGKKLDAPVHTDIYMLPATRERNKPYNEQARMSPKDMALAHMKLLEKQLEYPEFIQSIVNTIVEVDRFVPGEEKPGCMSCYAGRCSYTINWQGEMRPCVILSEPAISVFDVGFKAAWKYMVEEVDKIRTASKCTVCSKKSFCQTCAASALCEEGSYDRVPQYLCEYTEELLFLLRQRLEQEGIAIKYE